MSYIWGFPLKKQDWNSILVSDREKKIHILKKSLQRQFRRFYNYFLCLSLCHFRISKRLLAVKKVNLPWLGFMVSRMQVNSMNFCFVSLDAIFQDLYENLSWNMKRKISIIDSTIELSKIKLQSKFFTTKRLVTKT